MQRKPLFLSLTAAVVVLITCCGRSDKSVGVAVPLDAAIVIHLNTPALSSKLTWQEIKQTNWFKEMYADADDSLAKKLMDDPGNSGINTESDLIYFIKRRAQTGYMVFEGSLKDVAAFEAFNKKISKNATTSKVGDLFIMKAQQGVVTWTGNRFAYIMDASFPGMNNKYSPPTYDSTGQPEYSPPPNYPTDSLVKFANELYALKADNSLGSDKKFASLLKEPGDVHFWLNASAMSTGMLTGPLSMTNLNTLLDGNVTAAALNFDNGRITMNSRTYYNKELGKLYEKYRMKNIDADALGRIPSQNVVAAFAMNYPPEGLKEFLKVLGVDGFVNGFMGENGYSMDEFVKANKGDLLVTVSDFEVKEAVVQYPGYDGGEAHSETKTEPNAKVLFGVAINDKPAFDKLVGIVKAKMGNMQLGTPKISYGLNDKWFAIGNTQEQVNQFLAGGNGSKQPYISKISGHPFGMYVDLQKILKTTAPTAKDSSSRIALEESIKIWEDIVVTGGELKDGAIIGSFEVNLVDKNTNSLKQLNQYADKLAATRKRGF